MLWVNNNFKVIGLKLGMVITRAVMLHPTHFCSGIGK